MPEFVPHPDLQLGTVVKSEKDSKEIAHVRGLVEVTGTSVEAIEKQAQANLEARKEKRDGYIKDSVARAVEQADAGVDESLVVRELEDRMASERAQQERDAESRRRDEEADAAERREWLESRYGR